MNDRGEQHQRALYIDLELTCWVGPPPAHRKPEIIEIGAVEVDLTDLAIVREVSYLVRPKDLNISRRCTHITGLSADDLRPAPMFPETVDLLVRDFAPATMVCCAWGRDADIFADACRSHSIRTPLRNVIDIGNLFWRVFLLRQQPSLKNAVKMLGLEFEGVPHTALADARNTARVHTAMIQRVMSVPEGVQPIGINVPRSTVLADKLRSAVGEQFNPST